MTESQDYSAYTPAELRTAIEYMRIKLGVKNLEFQPGSTRGLYAQSSRSPEQATILTKCDPSIAPFILINHHWEVSELMFFLQTTKNLPDVTVVDVGANMGLFARQVLGWSSSRIQHLFAYEPEPGNFACLQHNLSPFGGQVIAELAALAEQDGTLPLHIDRYNCGNYSFVASQIPDIASAPVIQVRTLAIAQESMKWLRPGFPIFYKSDTQCYDELLVTLLPDDVVAAMVGGIIEVEGASKPDFSMQKFRDFIDRFPNKALLWLEDPDQPVNTEQVMNFLAGTEAAKGVNIAFSR